MGLLFKAAVAFFVAFLVVAPDRLAAHFDTPRIRAVKAELAAERPAARLLDIIGQRVTSELHAGRPRQPSLMRRRNAAGASPERL